MHSNAQSRVRVNDSFKYDFTVEKGLYQVLVLDSPIFITIVEAFTAWKLSKYGVISGPYFPVFGLNTGKYGLEKTPYLDTFHVVII